MVAYFVRRLVKGVVSLLGTTLVLYSLVLYFPGGVMDIAKTIPHPKRTLHGNSLSFLCSICREYHVEKPWPANYLTWLVDPDDITQLDPNDNTRVIAKGVDIHLGTIYIQGSGILTGDWGYSHQVRQPFGGQPVLQVISPHPWLLDVILLSLALLGMVYVLFQRMDHRPIYSPPRFPFTPHDRASLTFHYTRHS